MSIHIYITLSTIQTNKREPLELSLQLTVGMNYTKIAHNQSRELQGVQVHVADTAPSFARHSSFFVWRLASHAFPCPRKHLSPCTSLGRRSLLQQCLNVRRVDRRRGFVPLDRLAITVNEKLFYSTKKQNTHSKLGAVHQPNTKQRLWR